VSSLAKDYNHFDKYTKLHGVTSGKTILTVTSAKAHIFTLVAVDGGAYLPFRKYSVRPNFKCEL
jgi:hypothetical protein